MIFANLLSEKLGFQKVYEIPNGLSLGSSQSSDLAKEVKVNNRQMAIVFPQKRNGNMQPKEGKNTIPMQEVDFLKDVVWYRDNSEGKTHFVGQKKANGFWSLRYEW